MVIWDHNAIAHIGTDDLMTMVTLITVITDHDNECTWQNHQGLETTHTQRKQKYPYMYTSWSRTVGYNIFGPAPFHIGETVDVLEAVPSWPIQRGLPALHPPPVHQRYGRL